MKTTTKILFPALLYLLISAAGCNNESTDQPRSEEIQSKKLTATWKIKSAVLDNVEQDDYGDFVLTLSGGSGSSPNLYVCTGRPLMSPWMAGGTWSFGSSVLTQLIRDPKTADKMPMTYSVTDTELVLEFQFAGEGYPGGRAGSVGGSWKFKFARQ